MGKPLQFSRKYVLSLAAVSVAILVGGAILRPERRDAIEKVSEQERTRLQRLVRKRSVEEIGEYIAEAAMRVSPRVVYSQSTQTSGVLWGPGGLVIVAANGSPILGESTFLAGEAKLKGTARFARPDLPFAAFKLASNPPEPPGVVSLDALKMGQWLVAVWRNSSGSIAFSPGLLGGSSSAACLDASLRTLSFGVALPKESAGGAIFDLDGALVALLIPCEGTVVPALPESVVSHFTAAPTPDDQLANRFGITIEPGNNELLVTMVWPGYPAALAGLEKGDALLGAPNLNNPEPRKLRVRRQRRTLDIDWPYQPPPAESATEKRP